MEEIERAVNQLCKNIFELLTREHTQQDYTLAGDN